jgi:predicted glutamine amidotransferase
MCGHVGVYGNISDPVRLAFHWLLHFDAIRGHHSTGVAAIHDNKVALYKQLGLPHNLYNTHPEDWKNSVYQPKDVRCLIGHNRFATQGQIVRDNAHPFEFDNLVGAHNGTVQKWSLYKLKGNNQFDIDSKVIFNHLSETKGDVQSVWDAADGAMALVWWDKLTSSLKVVRNRERPLFMCRLKATQTVVWASESWMIREALGHCRVEHEEITSIDVDTLYNIQLKDNKIKVHKSKLKAYSPPNYTYTPATNNVFRSGGYSNGGGSSQVKDPLEKIYLKIFEFQPESGLFFGQFKDGTEVRIPTAGGLQKEKCEFISARSSKGETYYYGERKNFFNLYNMQNIHAGNLHVATKEDYEKKEDIKVFVANIAGKYKGYSENQYHKAFRSLCTCCGRNLPFDIVYANVNDFFFLSEEDIFCPTCKNEDWVVQEALSQSKVG